MNDASIMRGQSQWRIDRGVGGRGGMLPRLFAFLFAGLVGGMLSTATAGEAAPDNASQPLPAADTPIPGTYACWGVNNYGQLGLGDNRERDSARLFPLANVEMISTGDEFSLALAEGKVYVWGRNTSSQLGLGGPNPDYLSSPIPVSGMKNIVSVKASKMTTSYAVTTAGQVYGWGQNYSSMLGVVSGETSRTVFSPRLIPDLTGVREVAAGYGHALFLMNDQTVKALGDNRYGQLGIGDEIYTRGIPQTITELADVVKIDAGYSCSVALTANGEVWVWGGNANGALGLGDSADRYVPVRVTTVPIIVDIAAGECYLALLDKDGYVWTAGDNHYGQLGLGDEISTNRFRKVEKLSGVQKIAAGNHSTYALRKDNSLYVAGYNTYHVFEMHNYLSLTNFTRLTTLAGVEEAMPGPDFVFVRYAEQTDVPLFWRNVNNHAASLWYMNGEKRVASATPPAADPLWRVVGAADFDDDAKTDILWQHATSHQLALWIMDGEKRLSSEIFNSPGPEWRVAAVADFDRDWKADILWQHRTTHQLVLWRMDKTKRLSSGNIAFNPGGLYRVVGAADFDGDSRADILFQNINTRQFTVWIMDGPTRLASWALSPIPPAEWKVAGVADYYADGTAGVLFRHVNTHEMVVWRYQGLTRISAAAIPATLTTPRDWEVQPAR